MLQYYKLVYPLFLLIFALPQASIAGDAITFKKHWEYKNFPFVMQLYEVDADVPVWNMGSAKKLPTFIKSKVKNNEILVTRGERKKFALVFFNKSTEAKYFFASPHEINPPELSLGFKYNCLCMNHAFVAKPQSYWYRVVQLRVGKSYRHKNKLKITHTMVGIDADEGKKFLDPAVAL